MLLYETETNIFDFAFLYPAPQAPTLVSFTDVKNTSVSIHWQGPPDWTDYDDFELQWTPTDPLVIFNPYSTGKSYGRIVTGLKPGRLYEFSVKSVSGNVKKTFSQPTVGSVRTSESYKTNVHKIAMIVMYVFCSSDSHMKAISLPEGLAAAQISCE